MPLADTIPKTDGSEPPALFFQGVSHAYGETEAVRGLDLTIKRGETLCLLGPSGCGKTTALRIAAGLETPRSGTVTLNGTIVTSDTVSVPPEKRQIGLVFQDFALFPHLTVARNVAFGLRGLPSTTAAARVAEALADVDMSGYEDAYPHQLSGGQQQRVALARALAPKPSIVLLDEPFSGLDARLRDAVRDRTLHALQHAGTAALMVTHDAEEAMYLSDRIAVMRNGRIEQVGTPEQLYCDPQNSFVAAFFGDVNRFPAFCQDGRVKTPFGELESGSGIDNGDVEVVIRPEGLTLTPTEASAAGEGYARVLASRLLGRTSLIHLQTIGSEKAGDGEGLHLHARVPGAFLPEADSVHFLHLDRSQAFVFPPDIVT